MFDSTLGGDRIKACLQPLDATDAHHVALPSDFFFESERDREGVHAVLRKSFDDGAVVEFAHDARRDPLFFDPKIEHAPIGAAIGRHEQWHILQALREAAW